MEGGCFGARLLIVFWRIPLQGLLTIWARRRGT
jgi:hypothetical protein